MYLNRGDFNLRRTRRNNMNRVALYIVLIMAGLYVLNLDRQGKIDKPFLPTATATRSPASYSEEAQAQFSAGRLKEAIAAYQNAIELDPTRVDYWIQLARIQVYADHPADGLESASRAVLIAPENSTAHAVHALALDWAASQAAKEEDKSKGYSDAGDAAVRAIQLDPNNALAHAYYAEVLVDLQRYAQARDEAKQALQLDPNSMDAYRVYGYYLESTANYEEAIQAYQSAIKINPNLPFLFMQAGVNFRILQQYDTAIEYFRRASSINSDDINPLLQISKTYFQTGEYGRSSQYLEAALTIDSANANVHGRLGLVYFKALNYESAIIELSCAVDGCTTDKDTIDDKSGAPVLTIEPLPLNDRSSLEIHYTYSSVLAALSTPTHPYCNRARPLFQEILAFAGDDPVVAGIVQENENICVIAEGTATAAALGGGATPAPGTGTPTPGAGTGTPAPIKPGLTTTP